MHDARQRGMNLRPRPNNTPIRASHRPRYARAALCTYTTDQRHCNSKARPRPTERDRGATNCKTRPSHPTGGDLAKPLPRHLLHHYCSGRCRRCPRNPELRMQLHVSPAGRQSTKACAHEHRSNANANLVTIGGYADWPPACRTTHTEFSSQLLARGPRAPHRPRPQSCKQVVAKTAQKGQLRWDSMASVGMHGKANPQAGATLECVRVSMPLLGHTCAKRYV